MFSCGANKDFMPGINIRKECAIFLFIITFSVWIHITALVLR